MAEVDISPKDTSPILNFGKYKGMTLRRVLVIQPGYVAYLRALFNMPPAWVAKTNLTECLPWLELHSPAWQGLASHLYFQAKDD